MANVRRSRAGQTGPLGWIPDPETELMTESIGPATIVREALAADAPAVATIGRVAVRETYSDLINARSVMAAIVGQSYALDALRGCIARCVSAEDAHFLVAERRGRIVGF